MRFKLPPLLFSKFTARVSVDQIIFGREHCLESSVVFKVLCLDTLSFGLGAEIEQVSDSFRICK